jgi:multidrug efflux pump subunit AcrA (membrane-fusion protein)
VVAAPTVAKVLAQVPRIALSSLVVVVSLVGCAAHAPGGPPASAARSSTTAPSSTGRTVSATGAISGVSPDGSGGVVVALVEEADLVHFAPGQHAQVRLPALPGVTLDGTVRAVAPSAVAVSGVTSYYVTVLLTGGDPRLRAGQTAEVSVPTGERGR